MRIPGLRGTIAANLHAFILGPVALVLLNSEDHAAEPPTFEQNARQSDRERESRIAAGTREEFEHPGSAEKNATAAPSHPFQLILQIADSLEVFALHGVGGILSPLLLAVFVPRVLCGPGHAAGIELPSRSRRNRSLWLPPPRGQRSARRQ